MGFEDILRKITDCKWELPKGYKKGMRVPAYLYINRKLMQLLERDALEQAANVATLPGIQVASLVMPDVHVGYGFPIGGVAAFDIEDGIVSPGGVGFDINCLSSNTRVLSDNGYWIEVKDLVREIESEKLRVYDISEGHNECSEISFISERNADEFAIKIRTEGGRELEGSYDHPVLTENGYKKLSEIRKGEYVVVYPFEGVEYEEVDLTVVDENDFDEKISEYLKDKNLVPLRTSDRRTGVIARIIGFAIARGSCCKSSVRICCRFEDEGEIVNDLRSLGIGEIHVSHLNGNESLISICSEHFACFMNALGLKDSEDQRVPEWIKASPKWIRRNFLAGLFGACAEISLCGNSVKILMRLGRQKLLYDVRDMLEEFGISCSVNGYELSITDERSVTEFLARIGYEYSREKKELGLIALEYLRRKEKSLTLDEFWKKYGLSGGFVLDRVVDVKKIKPSSRKFYDIGVFHEAHNFIANGIVVHNCGVRLIRTNLTVDEVRPKIRELIDELFVAVPSGVGSEGRLRVSDSELDEILVSGAKWAIENGYGYERDLKHCEENGAMEGAKPEVVSRKARERGRPQLGTLGSGNHFLEVQYVDKIFDEKAAKAMGLEEGLVTVMVHCGSRGLGHQVCSDFLVVLDRAVKKYGISLPDRQLACAPIKSREGEDYFGGMAASANYAWCNRQIITHWTRETFQKVFRMSEEDLGMELIYDVAHNIAKFEVHRIDGEKKKVCVHRKGATRAFGPNHPDIPKDYRDIGQPVLIPGSMGTPSYVLVGTERAMEESFGSTCHGSGRVMSRAEAKRRLKGTAVRDKLLKRGIYVRATQGALLAEEAPEAYKKSDDVVEVVHRAGLSKLVARLLPLGVAKG